MNKSNIIIKVGKSSNIKLRNIICHRAITLDDIDYYINKYNSKVVILEDLQSFEVVDVIPLIERLVSDNVIVFIYDYNNNSYSKTLAEKAGTELATNLQELQHSIAQSLSVSVMTNWSELDKIDDLNDLQYVAENIPVKKVTNLKISKDELPEQDINKSMEQEQELYDLLDKVTREKNALKSELDVKSDKISSLMNVIDSIQEQRDIYKSLIDEFNSFEVEYVVNNSIDTTKISKENDDLKAELSKKDVLIDSMLKDKGNLDSQINQLLEYKEKFDSLHKNNIEISAKLISYESDKKEWDKKEKDYRDRIQSSIDEIDNLQKQVIEYEGKWGLAEQDKENIEAIKLQLDESQKSNSKYLLQINNLSSEKSKLIQEQLELEQKITALNNQVQQLKIISNSSNTTEEKEVLEKEIGELNKLIKEFKEKLNSEHNARAINNIMFLQSLTEIQEKEKEQEIQDKRIKELKSLIGKYENQIEDSKNKYNILNKKYVQSKSELEIINKNSKEQQDILNEQIELLTSKVQKLQETQSISDKKSKDSTAQIQELEMEIMELQMNSDTTLSELANSKSKVMNLELQLEEKSQEIDTLKQSLQEAQAELEANTESAMKSAELVRQDKERNKTLEISYRTLQVAMDKAVKELNDTKRKLVATEATNRKLEESHSKLNQSFLNLVGRGAGGSVNISKPKFNCDYTSSGVIIPVFGTGSYGVTNITMSIAKIIKDSNILVMDLDLMGSKLDVLTKKMPIIPELVEIPQQFNRTALCSFIEKGYNYFNNNRNKILQRVGETSARSSVDYFSGLCGNLNTGKLLMADFTHLLNDLGMNYDYIIVDLGKIGSSDVTDALIKMFVDISKKAVCVTLSDGVTCRNGNIKISLANVDTSKLMWILNLATTTSVDELTKKSIGKSEYSIMPLEMRIYNQHITLDKVGTLKAKMRDIVDKLITQ